MTYEIILILKSEQFFIIVTRYMFDPSFYQKKSHCSRFAPTRLLIETKTQHNVSVQTQGVQSETCRNCSVSITGRARLIRSHSSARFYFELSGNSNYKIHCNSNYVQNFELEINSI